MAKTDKHHPKVIFTPLIPLSIIVVAVLVSTAVFFLGVRGYQARETTRLIIVPAQYQSDTRVGKSVVRLPVNESVEDPELLEDKIIERQLTNEMANRMLATLNDPVSAENDKPSSAQSVLLDVPFVPQAPFGEWEDPRQDYGCEEASLLMVWHYINDEPLSYSLARQEILAMSDWELEVYGEFRDSSAEHTVEIFQDYFEYDNIRLFKDIKIDDIKQQLDLGRPVIVPLDGQILDNPFYTPPGPLHHMLVVVGYDDNTGEFITNDPGTKRGENIRYDYDNFYESIRDYESGHGEPVTEIRRPMIVIY